MGNQLSQAFPPAATFTETSISDLTGKVCIVTGASSGVGKELARLLYSRNGTIYVGARSSDKAQAAIQWMQEQHPNSKGTLHHLYLDLNDLEGIKPSAEAFLSREKRLDVLFNNAGVMVPPQGSKTKQGYELQLGTNCVAPFLFTKLLTPILLQTAKSSEKDGVRVVWVSSSAAYFFAPTGGVDMGNLNYAKEKDKQYKYGVSKAGNILLAVEFQKRFEGDGVRSVSLNPGNLASSLQRHMPAIQAYLVSLITYPAVNGAHTELFAGFSPDVASLKQNEWVVPWGRIMTLRKDLADAGRTQEDGGSGNAEKFWEWCEREVERFL